MRYPALVCAAHPAILELSRSSHTAMQGIAARVRPHRHDMARNGASRLTDHDMVSVADDETTFDQLQTRTTRTIAHLEAFAPSQFEDAELRLVAIKASGADMAFDGHNYLFGFVLPNLYLHVTTAYAILRQAGVPLARPDFFGRVMPTRS